jgi:hypothetical protein
MRIFLTSAALVTAIAFPAIAQQTPSPANPPRIIAEPALRHDPPETVGRDFRPPLNRSTARQRRWGQADPLVRDRPSPTR